MQLTLENVGNRAMLSLDATRQCDSVEWSYLWHIFYSLSLEQWIIQGIQALYSAPTACLRIKNYLSEPFQLQKGTRQGYPLSSLLFALTLVPLAALIRDSEPITRFLRGQSEDKFSLATGNVLLFQGDIFSSCPYVAYFMVW